MVLWANSHGFAHSEYLTRGGASGRGVPGGGDMEDKDV